MMAPIHTSRVAMISSTHEDVTGAVEGKQLGFVLNLLTYVPPLNDKI